MFDADYGVSHACVIRCQNPLIHIKLIGCVNDRRLIADQVFVSYERAQTKMDEHAYLSDCQACSCLCVLRTNLMS